MYDKNIPQFSGNAIGLILPNDILDVEKQEFEAILQNLTKADQELKQYEECLEYSEQVSEGLKKGAEYVGRGMVKGAIKSSEWMYLGLYIFFSYFHLWQSGWSSFQGSDRDIQL